VGRAFQSLLTFSDDEPLSVGEVTRLVKSLIESDEQLKDVRVQGEISNLSRPASGHIYFTLKDGVAQIKCAMWKSQVGRLRMTPRDGEAVIARGRVGVYESSGVYQLYVDALTPVGVGDLAQEFERLKLKLQAEGLFDADRKRALPAFPKRIGVVTSASAAALQDILNVLRRRFPVGEVLLSPTLVQGDDAPPQIVNALARLQGRCDVILIARGGGSIEELWAFNDERVVRAVADSATPTISGVGHEIDFTLTDFAADLRAPTPSAAAEMLTPDINDLRMRVDGYAALLDQQILALIRDGRTLLNDAQRALRLLSPAARVAQLKEGLGASRERLDAGLRARLSITRAELDALGSRLATLGPDATLARGYAIVTRAADGRIVRSPSDAVAGDALTIRTAAGEFGAKKDDGGNDGGRQTADGR
jgi:exodeoxyribonuclease VII large subunit